MVSKNFMTLFLLINQKRNRTILQDIASSNRIANAYLFYGQEGSGHEGFALEFAAMLNCEQKSNKPCGICPSCRKMKTLEHANLQLLFPLPIKSSSPDVSPFANLSNAEMEEIERKIQSKAKNPYEKLAIQNAHHISINFIREIKRNIYLAAQEVGWKVTIVLDAHLMTEQASNAFLKILEEPPPNSTFILTSSAPDNLLPTIRSRCQPLYFPPLPESEIESFLKSKGVSEKQINLITQLSAGNISHALSLSEDELLNIQELTLEILRSIAVWNIKKIYDIIGMLSSIYRQEPDKFSRIMLSILFWIRDAAVLRTDRTNQDIIHSGLRTEISNFVNSYPNFDEFALISSFENCIDFVRRNVYINLALTDLFFKIKESLNK
jgi:DNA polymerase-3 subunit delta'